MFSATKQSRLRHGLATHFVDTVSQCRTRSRSCDSPGGSRMQPKARFSVGGSLLSGEGRTMGKESGDLEGVDVRLLGPAASSAGALSTTGALAAGGAAAGSGSAGPGDEMRMFQCSFKRSSRFTTSVPATDVLTRIQEVVESDVNPLPTPTPGCSRKVRWVVAESLCRLAHSPPPSYDP